MAERLDDAIRELSEEPGGSGAWLRWVLAGLLFASLLAWIWLFFLDDFLRERYSQAQAEPVAASPAAGIVPAPAETEPPEEASLEALVPEQSDAGVDDEDAAQAVAVAVAEHDASVPEIDAGAAPPVIPDLDPNREIVVQRVEDVEELARLGRIKEAIAGLGKLKRSAAKSPMIHYMLGNLLFEQERFAAGLKAYRVALDGDAAYRSQTKLNANVVRALTSKKRKTRATAERIVLKQLKKSALPELRELAESGDTKAIRKRAAKLLRRVKKMR